MLKDLMKMYTDLHEYKIEIVLEIRNVKKFRVPEV